MKQMHIDRDAETSSSRYFFEHFVFWFSVFCRFKKIDSGINRSFIFWFLYDFFVKMLRDSLE